MSEHAPISEHAERYLRDQRLYEWSRSCLSKIRYDTQAHANVAISRARHRRRVALFTYYCRHCGGWHLTRQLQDCQKFNPNPD